MNINEHKWTNTRTYCTDKNMLLTKSIKTLSRIARFQRKIRKFRLARSQSVIYIYIYIYTCFQVGIVKRKKPCYQLPRKNWWLPRPQSPTPDKGSTRNVNGRNYSFYHSWRPSWRPLFAENSRAPYGARANVRAVRYAQGNFPPPPPPFWKSWIRHCISSWEKYIYNI